MTVRRRALLAGLGAAGVAGAVACTPARPDSAPSPVAPGAGPPVAKVRAVTAAARATTLLVAYDLDADADPAVVLRDVHERLDDAPAIVSVGASLFDRHPGLARPRLLTAMPAFPADVLDERWCHGDVLVQTSGPGPVVSTGLRERWRMPGFHPPAPDGSVRNLFGFREGTGNPDVTDAPLIDSLLPVRRGDDEPAWCVGGSYQVVRLIQLATAIWDGETVAEQERVFGRRKETDAPLGAPDAGYATDPEGRLTALDAHIRRANPHTRESEAHRILRRSWSYRHPDAGEGQIFTCFQRDLEKGFVTVQRRLAGEALERYTLTFGGGYYFTLPDPSGDPSDFRGRTLVTRA
ncbi:Dyp-type peroxidase [Actinoplanes sp. RD1]|uniref:Dyp-type peroxidase n=1 Tax=Actinoplanes sp. RD1 TaxID=3064538 RepID=UPI00274099C5|nr:Dyp-type peroxidase [Actinoplanes sp. RD1]